ncbi:MAG: bacillithiol system redox-active protein YtxJ [Candidatus Hydrogenedentes bacterium]|nr:bacillithiol system redox-active protein YtxJ [Candidatus Hydrogenedentota bacterium]
MNSLKNLADLDACLNESTTRPVFIFKHSTACPISSEAYRQVAKYTQAANENDPKVYMVRVIEERPVSNQIAEELALQHKSPQLILVKDRSVLWSASHYGINEQAIRDAVSGHITARN